MCRVVGYVGNSEEDLRHLFAGFSQGSACDPWLNKAGIDSTCHKHGWGYAILDANGLHHYRTRLPVYEDKNGLPRLSGKIYAILHSRLASDPSLDGHIFAHPFAGSTSEAVFFFAHNGGVDPGNLPQRMVDSEWAFQKILEAGAVEPALPLLREKTKPNAALNLIILTLPRNPAKQPALQYLNFHKAENDGRRGYYQMYCGDMPGGKAVVSSTIAELPAKNLANITKTAFDQLQTL